MTVPAIAGPEPAAIAQGAIALYPIPDDCRATLVRYGENTTYNVGDGSVSLALRLARPGYQSRASIESEMAWMSALREHGIDTPAAVRGRDGELVQQLQLPDGVQAVVAFEWVQGMPLTQVQGLEPWRQLGEIMARVHGHARRWSRPDWFTRPAWDLEALLGDSPRWGTPVPPGVWSEGDRELIVAARAAARERLERLGTSSPTRFGLIHTDLGFENVLVRPDGSTVVIDFDDCGDSWYLYELASALYQLVGTPGFEERRDALAAGYRAVGELPDGEIAELPTFLMCRRLATLGWTFSRSDTAHAQRQRARRLATSPAAAREFLEWHRTHTVCP
jgi:Ser/Thr protein kinase RdoA (MazF antagonist)